MQHSQHSYTIKLVKYKDDLYTKSTHLRNEVLLRPINLPDHYWEMNDHKSFHFVYINKVDEIIGCLLLNPINNKELQLMQMAVKTSYQGHGIGKNLVEYILKWARQNDFKSVFCHSRENAIPFYSKLGFLKKGEKFEEVGINHLKMYKLL